MQNRLRRLARPVVAALIGLIIAGAAVVSAQPPTRPTLVGRAVLPADTFADGPASGARIDPPTNNGRTAPFPRQPVQGISAVLRGEDEGTFLVLADNGYGAKANSPDFNLRFYRVRPDWRTAAGGAGTVAVLGFVELRDPDRQTPFPIVNEGSRERVLTGADFDIESFRRAPDGTFWFGEEFGPFLLHTDATGRLLRAPIPLPIPPSPAWAFWANGAALVRSPDNPAFAALAGAAERAAAANLPSSRGFEGMALGADGTKLYPMLEGALNGDPDRARLLISEFDLATRAYTGRAWYYRMESAAHSIGDLTAINRDQFLVIERDQNQGAAARFKKVYLIDIAQADQGYVRKTELVDLLAIADPSRLSGADPNAVGLGDPFTFPFVTIESVLMLDPATLLIINDNNYPFSTGRRPNTSDDNEFIQIRLPAPLNVTTYR